MEIPASLLTASLAEVTPSGKVWHRMWRPISSPCRAILAAILLLHILSQKILWEWKYFRIKHFYFSHSCCPFPHSPRAWSVLLHQEKPFPNSVYLRLWAQCVSDVRKQQQGHGFMLWQRGETVKVPVQTQTRRQGLSFLSDGGQRLSAVWYYAERCRLMFSCVTAFCRVNQLKQVWAGMSSCMLMVRSVALKLQQLSQMEEDWNYHLLVPHRWVRSKSKSSWNSCCVILSPSTDLRHRVWDILWVRVSRRTRRLVGHIICVCPQTVCL